MEQYVDLVFPNTLRRSFTYKTPAHLQQDLSEGQRVIAPLRNVPSIGFVLKVHSQKPRDIKLKEISEIIDPQPLIPGELFQFLKRLANYYLAPLGRVLSATIPPEIQLLKYRQLEIRRIANKSELGPYAALYDKIVTREVRRVSALTKHFSPDYLKKGLHYLKQYGIIRESIHYRHPFREGIIERWVRLMADRDALRPELEQYKRRAPRQWEILQRLVEDRTPLRAEELSKYSSAALKSLAKKELITIERQDITFKDLWHSYHVRSKDVELDSDQSQVYGQIAQSLTQERYAPFLIEGVTGSGKTEIYIKLIEKVLSAGQNAIVLVPEITLTTHLAGRFRGAFGSRVALWHSQLSRGHRSKIWHNILKGELPLVIGARSAIFLPMPDLQLIIVDEEQDSSYKQKGLEPRYNARDAALMRGQGSGATVVLGSATPSIESHYNANTGKITKLHLARRYASAPTPLINVVDMKKEWQKNEEALFSELLLHKIADRIDKGEQVLLLQNRRGYSNVILCAACGWRPSCRNCDITLTYHKKGVRLICHYCNYMEKPPAECPQCGGQKFYYPGFGTQRVETALQTLFPEVTLARLDIDTTRIKGFSQQTLARFERGDIQILIGTQMIAKGLDFPRVSLVGVLNADVGLYLPDFRARERVFQLLYQVAGRSGRGDIHGEVVIQTLVSEDFTIQCAVQQNLKKFVNNEYNERNPVNYPPFSRLAQVLITAKEQKRAAGVSAKIMDYIKKHAAGLQILGPAPAPLPRIKNRYRYMGILKSRKTQDPQGNQLRDVLKKLLQSQIYTRLRRQARIIIDIDPLDLL